MLAFMLSVHALSCAVLYGPSIVPSHGCAISVIRDFDIPPRLGDILVWTYLT
jgi:hypothetical protein